MIDSVLWGLQHPVTLRVGHVRIFLMLHCISNFSFSNLLIHSIYCWSPTSFLNYCNHTVQTIYIKLKSRLSVCPSTIPMVSNNFLTSRCTYQSIFCAKLSTHHLGITSLLNEASNRRHSSFTARLVQGYRQKFARILSVNRMQSASKHLFHST